VGTVYQLTLRQLAGRWRLLILAGLASLPVLMTALVVNDDSAPRAAEFDLVVLSAMLAGSVLPMAVLAIASAAFGNEIEDKTLANLTLAPVPRWRIAVPKLLAALTVSAPFVVLSAWLTAEIAFLGDLRATLAVTVSALAAVAMYGSFFTWLGLVTSQAVGAGLLYILIWEGLFSGFVAGARVLSIRYHATALMHALDSRRFASVDHPATWVATAVAIIVVGGFLLLTVRKLRRMDVP